jgi:aspartate carbamoyltransferase catalytic subunit
VTVAAPPTLIPSEIGKMGVRVVHKLDEAVKGADVIMMLRIQLERQGKLSFPSLREYYNTFGLTPERLARANSDAIIMHPGPMNRGVEIASDVADDPRRSVILEQVTNGVAVRMAVLYLLGGAHNVE